MESKGVGVGTVVGLVGVGAVGLESRSVLVVCLWWRRRAPWRRSVNNDNDDNDNNDNNDNNNNIPRGTYQYTTDNNINYDK